MLKTNSKKILNFEVIKNYSCHLWKCYFN